MPRRVDLARVLASSAVLVLAACSGGGGGTAPVGPGGSSPSGSSLGSTAPATAAPLTATARTAPSSSPPPTTRPGGAGCGATTISSDPPPAWAPTAPAIRWLADGENQIAGFLFAYPLRHGHPENPANKVLWIVNGPRDGAALVVDLHPVGAAAPVVTDAFPADSSPGEIYPSIVDVPTAGCWHATFRWNGHTAELDLPYS